MSRPSEPNFVDSSTVGQIEKELFQLTLEILQN